MPRQASSARSKVSAAAPYTGPAEAACERCRARGRRNARYRSVVECRFFARLAIADSATTLHTSPDKVKRDWLLGRAWLYREMAPPGDP